MEMILNPKKQMHQDDQGQLRGWWIIDGKSLSIATLIDNLTIVEREALLKRLKALIVSGDAD